MKPSMRAFARQWVLPFIDPRALASMLRMPGFFRTMWAYRRRSPHESVRLIDAYPCLADRVSHTPFDPHYFYQGAWLARRLRETNPALHVDVGSSVLMLGVLSAHVPTAFVDYRPLQVELPGIFSIAGTITSLPFASSSLVSLSSLHVIEHIGLGRYGDPIDPHGSQAAVEELARVVRPGGRLFVSVPVGRERVCFNAHRVFAPETIVRYLPGFRLAAFALIDDRGRYLPLAEMSAVRTQSYGCGLFELVKDDP